jgi:hypothetical protein
MDQDIMFQHTTAIAAGAETTSYFQLPFRCTVRNVRGIIQGTIGSDETVTVTSEPTVGGASTAIGVLTFSAGAAGTVGAWVADATTGATQLEADTFLKFVVSSVGADDEICNLNIELDPYAR